MVLLIDQIFNLSWSLIISFVQEVFWFIYRIDLAQAEQLKRNHCWGVWILNGVDKFSTEVQSSSS